MSDSPSPVRASAQEKRDNGKDDDIEVGSVAVAGYNEEGKAASVGAAQMTPTDPARLAEVIARLGRVGIRPKFSDARFLLRILLADRQAHAAALTAAEARGRQQAEQELQHWRTAAENFGHTDAHSWSLSTDELIERVQQAEQARDEGAQYAVQEMQEVRQAAMGQDPALHSLQIQVEALTQALKAAQQFVYPEISRGPAVDGWQNTIAMIDAALTGAPK